MIETIVSWGSVNGQRVVTFLKMGTDTLAVTFKLPLEVGATHMYQIMGYA